MRTLAALLFLLPWLTLAQVPVMPGGAVPWYRISSLGSPPNTNKFLWFKPDGMYSDTTLTTPCTDGDLVYGWKDAGLYSYNVTNSANISNVMRFRSAGPNGYGCLDTTKPYTNTHNIHLRGAVPANYPQPVTLFAVYLRTNFIDELLLDSFGGPQIAINGGTETNSAYAFAGSSTLLRFVPPVRNSWNLLTAHYDSGSSYVRTNGAPNVTGSVYGNGFPGLIIANSSDFTYPFVGKIAEVLVYTNISTTTMSNVESYLMQKYALPIAGTSPSITTFVTGQTLGSTRNNFSGTVGFMGTASGEMTVTSLGRWVYSGNSQTHDIRIRVTGSGWDIDSKVTVDCNGATAGQFLYANLPVAVEIRNGATVIIESTETSGGDTWYDNNTTITHTSVLTDVKPSANGGYPGGSADATYGPVSFKYHLQ